MFKFKISTNRTAFELSQLPTSELSKLKCKATYLRRRNSARPSDSAAIDAGSGTAAVIFSRFE